MLKTILTNFLKIIYRFFVPPPNRCQQEVFISNLLLFLFFPIYYLLAILFKDKRICVFHCSFSSSPGHIAAEYQICSLLACENKTSVWYLTRKTTISKGFRKVFCRLADTTKILVFNSNILYYLILPFHAFQDFSGNSFAIDANHLLFERMQIKIFKNFSLRLLVLKQITNSELENKFRTIVNYLESNSQILSDLSNKIRLQVNNLEFEDQELTNLVKWSKHRLVCFHYKNSNFLSNAAVNAPTNMFISQITEFLTDNHYSVIRFRSSREPVSPIENLIQKRLSFYDQILLASHSTCAVIHASGLENIFALFEIPLILYGSWVPDLYGLNSQAIDIPAMLYDKSNLQLLSFSEALTYRSKSSYVLKIKDHNSIDIKMPKAGLVIKTLSYMLDGLSDANNNLEFVYPFNRETIGRRMINPSIQNY